MDDDWSPEWIRESPGFIPLPDDLKDEYHQRILQHLQVDHGWGNSARTIFPLGGTFGRVHELIANTDSGPHRTRFWIANCDGGLATFVVGRGDVDQTDIDRWLAASNDALAKLGEREPVAWRAHLAQHPAALPYKRYRLAPRPH